MASKTKFGQLLKANGVTQAEVADALGISETSLSNKANGKTPWKLHEVKRVARLLDMGGEEMLEVFD